MDEKIIRNAAVHEIPKPKKYCKAYIPLLQPAEEIPDEEADI